MVFSVLLKTLDFDWFHIGGMVMPYVSHDPHPPNASDSLVTVSLMLSSSIFGLPAEEKLNNIVV